MGTKLIVALNSDASVKQLKGPTRPVEDELTRAAALEFSFLLSIPTMAAATGYDLLKFLKPSGGAPGGAATSDSGPTLFEALQPQLGLRLRASHTQDQRAARLVPVGALPDPRLPLEGGREPI